MNLSFVFLCFSLATLSLASIPSGEEEGCSLSSKKLRKPRVKENGSAHSATGRSSQATKKPVKSGKGVPMKRLKKKAGATKGIASADAGKKSSAVSGPGKVNQKSSAVLGFFPKVLVELIGGYLEGSYSVVFTRNWSAVYSPGYVAVDSERHYLITDQDIQASSHGDGKPVSLGSPNLSDYGNFHSSHDGRFLFFTGKTKEQVDDYSSDDENSSEKTARWLVQETSTKSLKDVTLEGGEISNNGNEFMLSANGKTLLSTSWETSTTSVYQIKEREKAALASKKGDFKGYAHAISGNGTRVLMEPKRWKLEIHDISGDGSQLVLEINCAGATRVGPFALNNDGSKIAFIFDDRKLYIVDVDKQKDSISVSQLTPIDIPSSFISSEFVYDAKDRLYAFNDGNLWLVDPSKRELVSLEEAKVPQGYEIQDFAISPNVDYIALLFESEDENEKEEHQYQMAVKRNEEVTKKALLGLCGYKS